MKKIFFFLAIFISQSLIAQNVGVGITTPLVPLHISAGASGNLTPFSPLVVEGNNNTYINLLSPNLNETAVLFGKADNAASGGIVYNNINTLNGFQFRTAGNITQMILNNVGNVGIGISTPNAKLSVSADGNELTGTSLSNTFITNAGTLGNTPGSQLSLANIGFLSSNNSSLGIRAYRNSTGTDWLSTALLLGYDVDNNANAGAVLALAASGNIGIGVTAPFAPLTFNNNLGEKISLYGNVNSNYGFGIQASTFQIHSDAVSADIAFGYRSSNAFTENMRIKGNGNIGIGTTNPGARFHVSAGDASLALFGPNSYNGKLYVGASPNQGLALTAQVIATDGNLHIDPAPGKNMYLGYFQARDIYMNPAGGNVGIGNLNPTYQLDINNRIRIRSGGNNSVSAGLWLNNNSNTEAAFIGMEDDTHVGFFGIGTGWKFGMNTQNGALRINGSEGTSGQVLVSNGSSAAAAFTTIGNVITTDMKTGSGYVTISALFTDYHLPTLTHSITLTRRSKVIISANVLFQGPFCIGCTTAVGYFKLVINGYLLTEQIYAVPSSAAGNASFSNFMWVLEPGTHSLDFYVRCSDGPVHTVTSKYSSIIILPVD